MKLPVVATALVAAALAIGTPAFAQIDDAQIAAIVVTANQVDVDAGELAVATSVNPKVVEFARLMITDHRGVNQSATALVTKLGVKPVPSATSASLAEGGAANLERLRKLQGSEFDRAYVEHEVAYHRQVIEAIDGTLIPGAANAELKALLVKVRPAFDAHLDHARMLLDSLPKR
jgi:putative membrane protein